MICGTFKQLTRAYPNRKTSSVLWDLQFNFRSERRNEHGYQLSHTYIGVNLKSCKTCKTRKTLINAECK